jgi:hypothetical protein
MTQHPHLESGREFNDASTCEIQPRKQFRDSEEVRIANPELQHLTSTVDPEAAGVGVQLVTEKQPVQTGKSAGEGEPPCRQVSHAAAWVIR